MAAENAYVEASSELLLGPLAAGRAPREVVSAAIDDLHSQHERNPIAHSLAMPSQDEPAQESRFVTEWAFH